MNKTLFKKLTVVLTMASLFFAGCSSNGNTTDTNHVGETNVAESESTTPQTLAKEQQVLTNGKRRDVGSEIGNNHILFHFIPKNAVWDEAFGGYVMPNNGTNVNGESFSVKISYESIDKTLVYEDEKQEWKTYIEANKDKYVTSDVRYIDQIQAFSYLYATEEIVQTEKGSMVHTVAVMELRRYDRGGGFNDYSSLLFEVDILKPEGLADSTAQGYIANLYTSVIPGSNGESLK